MSSSQAPSALPPHELIVKHDAECKKFFIPLDNDCAELLYENVDDNTVNLFHTEVPLAFRGQGIAAILAKTAFAYVQAKNMKMKLTCDYLQKFYRENETPELRKILV